ncbi:MAG TPA: SDR family oxidoreductase [Pseudogracilibacillus sp.]|nr:SDR family oxidoreductase [Pseudogracilibacillus sp.]
MKLEGKVAVITGSASGIGKEIAKLFAKEGASVIISDLNEEGALEVVKEIKDNGGKATAVVTNVTNQEDVDNMIDQAVSTYGKLDILVNNAGIMDNMTPAADITDELWDRVFAINTTSMMRTSRKALSVFLKQENGVIINMASAAALHGSRAGVAYTAAKHAVIGLTKNIGFQYAEKGVRCNAIAPGGVNTAIAAGEPNEFGMERVMSGASNNPRSGDPIEVARVALFLASDDAGFINGEVIKADAGWMAY